MSDDLPERLRKMAGAYAMGDATFDVATAALLREAADEIERLRADEDARGKHTDTSTGGGPGFFVGGP